MPLPTVYTEETFAAYLQGHLGDVATALGWSIDAGSYQAPIEDTLLAMGVANIETVAQAEFRKLRALGRLYLWRAVASTTAADYQFSADGGSYSRDQVHAHALGMEERARLEAMEWDPAYMAEANPVTYHRDPYADHDDHLSDSIDQYLEELRS